MRATLIVPALFALSLIGGSALAERPGQDHPIREPRMDIVRDHGDVVDKYDHASIPMPSAAERTTSSSQPASRVNDKTDAGRSHGDMVDHTYSASSLTPTKSASQRYGSASYTHTPQATQKQQERQNCSTAQDDCAANRANKFGGTHDAHLVKSTKPGDKIPSYTWKSVDPSKASHGSKAAPANAAALSPNQQAALGKILKAKMCAHAASQDGCGGGDDD